MMEHIDTVVVGASAAGLSVAHCLAEAGVEHVVLEKEPHVGRAWRSHYERLHLHTTKGLSELPGLRWGDDVERYPPRLEVVRYLERYAETFGIAPRFEHAVTRIEREGERWRTTTSEGALSSKHVVIATGYTRTPHVPTWPGQDAYEGEVLHTSRYRNGDAWKGERVLVVGFGNSACEIAIDLCERGARPSVAVRGGVNIVPRDVFGVPILGIGISTAWMPAKLADAVGWPLNRLLIGDLTRYGLRRLPYGPITQIREHGRIPLLDIGTVDRIKRGDLAVRPNVERFTERGVVFEDGREEEFAAVILGTGYRPALADFLAVAGEVCDERGVPRRSGHETLPGLFFCGFYVSPTGMLREIAIEARRIAAAIARPPPSARSPL